MSTFLQIFLIVDIFILGVLASTAVRHGLAHFRPDKHAGGNKSNDNHLPPSVKQHMLEVAQENFQQVLTRSAHELEHDLEETAAKIRGLMDKLGSEVVKDELEHYKAQLDELRNQTEADITGAKTEIESHKDALRAQLAEEVANEKQHLLELIDTQLADSVASFLLETLQHEVDLGAQSKYLVSMLEEHKEEFKKELGDEVTAA